MTPDSPPKSVRYPEGNVLLRSLAKALPVIDRGEVYAISQSGLMAAFSVNTGERLWSRDIGGIQTPWAAGDYVYVLDNNARLICLTRKEGKVHWIHQLPQYENPEKKVDPIIWAGPVLISDRLVMTSSNGYAEAISPYDGKLAGRVEIPGATTIAPIVACCSTLPCQ